MRPALALRQIGADLLAALPRVACATFAEALLSDAAARRQRAAGAAPWTDPAGGSGSPGSASERSYLQTLNGRNAEFEEAIQRGLSTVIAHAKGFRRAQVQRGIESTERYLLMIDWETLEDHTVGFRNSPRVQELATSAFSVPISQERLDLLDADLTVMTTIGYDPQDLIDDPLYRSVPSAQAGRDVVFTDQVI